MYESVEMKNERKDIMAEERVEQNQLTLVNINLVFHDDVEPDIGRDSTKVLFAIISC